MKQRNAEGKDGTLVRMVLCILAAAAAVSAVRQFCENRDPAAPIPLWERYGPWVRENSTRAIALTAALFYGLSLILFPQSSDPEEEPQEADESYNTPC